MKWFYSLLGKGLRSIKQWDNRMKMQLTVIFQSNLNITCEYTIILNASLPLFMPTSYTTLLSIDKSDSLGATTQWTPSTLACNPYYKFSWRRPCNLFSSNWCAFAPMISLWSTQVTSWTAHAVKKKLKIIFSTNKVFQNCLKCLKPKINAEIHSLEECQYIEEAKAHYWLIPPSSFILKPQNNVHEHLSVWQETQ